MNNNYFKEYKFAKNVLNELVCQFYDYDLTMDEADKLGLQYTENDIFNSLNNVSCVFHRYNPEGLYLWKKLGLEKPIYLMREMWDLRLFEENNNYNYYRDYLELKLIDLYLCERYYSYEISIDDALKNNINYDYYIDEYDGKIDGCDHLFESAGENAWSLFGFDKNFVPHSKFIKESDKIIKELLLLDNVKKLERNK